MVNWLRQYIKGIITVAILFVSAIAMTKLKSAYEMSRNSNLENQFKIAQLIFFLTIGYIIFDYLFKKWSAYKALKQAHSQAQLDLLKSKMDPHFFFNTLNNLYGLAIEKSDETAPIILKLSDVMRYTIYDGAKNRVKLKDELAHLKQYIEIHKIRYKKNVSIDLQETVTNQDLEIAPLLFVNLLENAFKHGIESLMDDAFVDIEIQASNHQLEFTIENNYVKNEKGESGMGLINLKQRLQLIYPKQHQLEIAANETTYKVALNISIA
ncbi:sensor histidine kinase [Roseivirga sp.]|uniref:sensor histidine kinase n=1 Tax=Roseivirga sp. TaxID=1964215 RepID=UPI003B8DB510